MRMCTHAYIHTHTRLDYIAFYSRHNKLVRAGILGCAHFGIEAFEPETSNTVLAAVLVDDLCHPGSTANPSAGMHPVAVFSENAVHGGTFRVA